MKTLLITLEYEPFLGGVANYYKNMVKYWPDAEKLQVWTNEAHELINEKWPVLKWLPAIFKLKQRINAEKIEHVIVGQLLPIGSIVYYASKMCKFKYSVVIHGMDFTMAISQSRKATMARNILVNAEAIVCGNNYVANLVREFLGAKHLTKITVINPGVSQADYQPLSNELANNLKTKYDLTNKYVFLSLGRLVKRKGVDQVIMAMEVLAERLPNFIYLIAGTGPDEAYLKNYAASVSNYFSSHVKFLGAISEAEKWQWLNACDCLIMPAREENGDFEGFGIVYLEAGLAGKPVIAGASGGVADAVENMVNGLMVAPTDAEDIARVMAELMDDKELGQKLGATGRERAIKEFAWPELVNKFYTTIKI
ncbi:MAG: glycosyltransferase family 4 protein [bacterium]